MDEISTQLRNMFGSVTRKRYMIIAVFILVSAALIAGIRFIPKKFEADSTVFIEENIIKGLVKGIAVTSNIDDDLKFLRDAMLSRTLIRKVLDGLDPDIVNGGNEVGDLYIASLQVRTQLAVKGDQLFKVSIVDPSPDFAQQFINGLVNTYVEENIFAQREETYGANRFFSEQIQMFKERLDKSEDAIIEFRKKQQTYLSLNEAVVIEDLRRLMREVEAIRMHIDTLGSKKNALEEQLESVEPTISIMGSGEGRTPKIVAMQERLATLTTTYTDNYPEVIRLRAEIEELKRKMEENPNESDAGNFTSPNPLYIEIKQKALELDAERISLASMLAQTEQLIDEKESLLRELPENQKKLRRLEQERDSSRRIYQEMLERMGQAEVTKQMEIGDKATTFRVVDPAILPKVPVSPNMPLMIFGALIGGVAVGIGLALLVENLNAPVRGTSDLEELGLPVLSSIPQIIDPVKVRKAKLADSIAAIILAAYLAGVCYLLVNEIVKQYEKLQF